MHATSTRSGAPFTPFGRSRWKCDLACRHCGSRAGHARPDELSTAEAIDLVDQMAALGVKEVSLIGGEAYLREDWLDIVRRIRGHGMICQLTTGGRGLTEEILIAAKDAGLTGVGISIDGLESTHDSLRGVKGSFRFCSSICCALRARLAFATAPTRRSIA